jgi:hypothetical protein
MEKRKKGIVIVYDSHAIVNDGISKLERIATWIKLQQFPNYTKHTNELSS